METVKDIAAVAGPVLKIRKVHDRAVVHGYKHDGDVCFDIGVLVDGDANHPICVCGSGDLYESAGVYSINAGSTAVFHTGLSWSVSPGYAVRVYDRSSTGIKKLLALTNGVGIIDNGYRGEVMVALTNLSDEPVPVNDGERVAQGEVCPVIRAEIVEVNELPESERGTGGIGSTGRS